MIKKQVSRERGRERGRDRGAEREIKTIQQSEINEAMQSTDRKVGTRTDGHNSHIHTRTKERGCNTQSTKIFSSKNFKLKQKKGKNYHLRKLLKI